VHRPAPVEELRVPKRRVPVEVVLPGGTARRVILFLAEAAPGHEGPERPSDLLNGSGAFVPALDEASGGMTFLNRSSIALARVPADAEPEPGVGFTIPTEHEVAVRLLDGTELGGLVSYVLPPERSRLGDFLSEPAPFFRLLERGGVTLVGRAHVASVTIVAR
jgi:hypothetical protein